MQAFIDPEATDEAIYRAIEAVPPGSVTSYGRVADWLGLSTPRRPAGAMRKAPEDIPWWRIVRADGTFPPALLARALPHWREEGTPHTALGVTRSAFWEPTPADLNALEARVGDLREPAQGSEASPRGDVMGE